NNHGEPPDASARRWDRQGRCPRGGGGADAQGLLRVDLATEASLVEILKVPCIGFNITSRSCVTSSGGSWRNAHQARTPFWPSCRWSAWRSGSFPRLRPT